MGARGQRTTNDNEYQTVRVTLHPWQVLSFDPLLRHYNKMESHVNEVTNGSHDVAREEHAHLMNHFVELRK